MTDLIKKQLEVERFTLLSTIKKELKPAVESRFEDFNAQQFWDFWCDTINLETYQPKNNAQNAFQAEFTESLSNEQIARKLKDIVTTCALNMMCTLKGGVTLQSVTNWVLPLEIRGKTKTINDTVGAAALVVTVTEYLLYMNLIQKQKTSEGVMFYPNEVFQQSLEWVQHPLPLLCKPKEVNSLSQSGYLTSSVKGCLGGNPLNKQGQHVSYDVLNLVNKIPFVIDEVVFNEFHDSQKESEKFLERVQKMTREEGQIMEMTFAEYQNQQRNFLQHLKDNSVREVFFTQYYDHRGRLYCKGFQYSYQGNSFSKAVLKIGASALTPINNHLKEELAQQQQQALLDGWEI